MSSVLLRSYLQQFFKKQAFWYDTFPRPLEKTEDLKWPPNRPLESLLVEKLKTAPMGLYSSSQMKGTQHRPVVLNLITPFFTIWALVLEPVLSRFSVLSSEAACLQVLSGTIVIKDKFLMGAVAQCTHTSIHTWSYGKSSPGNQLFKFPINLFLVKMLRKVHNWVYKPIPNCWKSLEQCKV